MLLTWKFAFMHEPWVQQCSCSEQSTSTTRFHKSLPSCVGRANGVTESDVLHANNSSKYEHVCFAAVQSGSIVSFGLLHDRQRYMCPPRPNCSAESLFIANAHPSAVCPADLKICVWIVRPGKDERLRLALAMCQTQTHKHTS